MIGHLKNFDLRTQIDQTLHSENLTRRYKEAFRSLFANTKERFEVRLWDGDSMKFGNGPPEFTIVVHKVQAIMNLDQDSIAESYFRGDWSIEGDASKVFGLRHSFPQKSARVTALQLLGRVLFVPGTKNNADAVHDHYDYGDDFYLTFIDKKYRMYSHGHFHSNDDTLEESQEHKLECMFNSLGLQPGMTLLDIGGGWGPVPQYAGARGVKVTSVTVAKDSERYINQLIRDQNLPCQVIRTDFLDFNPEKPFDAIVIFGVIEHIPQYRAFVDKVWQCLAPGGRMYLDASATRVKYRMSPILRKTVWTSTATYLSLQDFMAELAYGGLQVLELKNESRDYELTMLHWARRFEANRDFIVSKWGERLYRIFQLYLWGGHHCFRWDTLQAYRMVIRRPEVRDRDPGMFRRLMSIVYAST